MQSIVEFRNVCFSYPGREVLHDISFAVEPGSFVGVVGPNGGGKTTLLRLILGLIRPEKGSISVFGAHPRKSRPQIGYIMQHMQFDEQFPVTVIDIALMGRAARSRLGPFGKRDHDKALIALEKVGMADYAGKPFKALSGGQRQRVLMAQALAGEPDLLLLDEPTANIDAEGEAEIHALLDALSQSLTVISVSHNINTVLASVSHVLCVNKTAALNRLDDLHPDLISRVKGGDIAVLHHELNCRVFDRNSGGDCGHPVHLHSTGVG